MLRFEDGLINLQELIRRLAGDVANVVIAAEAEQLCGETGNSRNGHRERGLEAHSRHRRRRHRVPRLATLIPLSCQGARRL